MLINKTAHEVNVRARVLSQNGGETLVNLSLPPAAEPCYVAVRDELLTAAISAKPGMFVDLLQVSWGGIQNVPLEETEGVFYVVSTIVARHPALRGRSDIMIPANVVKDGQGRIVGCTALQRSPYSGV